MARLPLKQNVFRRLFAYSGNKCAFSECNERIVDADGEYNGQICHIEAAEKGGERYNHDMDDEQRRSFENLVLLCYKHHRKTNNVIKYPVDVLKKIKQDHEAQYVHEQYQIPREIEEHIFLEVSKQLDKIEKIVVETKNLVEEGNKVGSNTLDNTAKIISMLEAKGISGNITIDDRKIYSEQLKFIVQIKESGKVSTAVETFIKFKSENWNNIDDELRFKVVANIASALFDQGKKDEAVTYLNELEPLVTKNADCLVYLALAYALQNQRQKFEEIRQYPQLKDSDNAMLWVAYIHMYSDSMPPEQLRDAIPFDALKKSEVLFTLGEIFINADREQEGFKLMEQSLEAEGAIESKKWQVQAIVTTRLLTSVVTPEKVAFRDFNKDDLDRIKGCVGQLTEVWNHISQTELATTWWHIVMNRGVAYKVLGDSFSAEKDMEAAWNLSRNFSSLKNLVCEYFDTDQPDKALRVLETDRIDTISGFSSLEFLTLKARCYSLKKQPDIAAAMLVEKLEEVEDQDKLYLLDLIVIGYFEHGMFEKALPFANQQIEELSKHPDGYLSKATCLNRLGDAENALDNLRLAVGKATETTVAGWFWYQLAAEFYDLKQYDEAIECLEKIYKPEYCNPTTRKLILANFYAGHIDQAESLCQMAKDLYPNDPLINEVLFRLYESSRRNDDAIKLLEAYLLNGESETYDHFRLLGIKFYHRIDDKENCKRLLLQIQNPKEYSIAQRFIIAGMHFENEEIERGLQIAYDTRIDNFEDVQAHQGYISFGIGKPEEPICQMFPKSIQIDTAVELGDKMGKKSQFFITDDIRVTGSNVLRSTDAFSRRLLNKTIGEEVVMENSVGVGNALKIISIISKNVYAFRESLKLLETKFAGQTGMIFFEMSEDSNFEEFNNYIIQQAEVQNKKRDEVLRLYNTGPLTIAMMANTFGKNIVEMWFAMMFESKVSINCYDRDESANLNMTKTQNLPVVVDSLSLLTIAGLLDRIELFDMLWGNCYVAQAVYDEIKGYRESIDKPRPEMTIAVHEGQIFDSTVSQENIDKQKVWLDKILLWCKESATIQMPKNRAVPKGRENLENMIGCQSFETMKLASELGGMILTDDVNLKVLALQVFRVGSFSSYQMITQAARDGKISPQEFTNFTRTLVSSNYAHIPITGEDLWQLYDLSGFKIQSPFTRAIRGLRILNAEFAARAISSFSKKVYLNINLPESRDQVFQFALRTIRQRKDFNSIKANLQVIIERDFTLMPQQKADFKHLLSAF